EVLAEAIEEHFAVAVEGGRDRRDDAGELVGHRFRLLVRNSSRSLDGRTPFLSFSKLFVRTRITRQSPPASSRSIWVASGTRNGRRSPHSTIVTPSPARNSSRPSDAASRARSRRYRSTW